MKIIGSNFVGHDCALFCIDTEKKSIFAMSTERVTRIKHDDMDISPILERYTFGKVDYVCHGYSNFSEPVANDLGSERIERLYREKALRHIVEPTYYGDLNKTAAQLLNLSLPKFIKQPYKTMKNLIALTPVHKKLYQKFLNTTNARTTFEKNIRETLEENNIFFKGIEFYDHHLCHAAGAYYFSPYAYKQKALSLSIDAWGDGYSSKVYIFNGNDYELISASPISRVDKTSNPQSGGIASLGYLYSKFTQALGLRRYSDEGKVEALAAFGEKDEELYTQLMDSVTITMAGMNYDKKKLESLYDLKYLQTNIERIGKEAFAATIQAHLEDVVVTYLNLLSDKYHDIEYLCLSGGVAANIIMSLNIYERTKFKNIYVIPSMGDEGVALGSALLKALDEGEDISWVNQHYMPYFGNKLSKQEIEEAIDSFKDYVKAIDVGSQWYKSAAESIGKNKIVAIVHGKMEFGPRALGNRSILANPIDPDVRELINLKVKKRPKYQPFCPSILEEERERLFVNSFPHKHMAIAFRVKEEFHDKIPSAIHIDGTARPQFVEREDNPDYFELIKEVKKHTGFGVVINTSFNLHGRTIVHSAEDAIQDYIDCNIDELYIEGFKIVRK